LAFTVDGDSYVIIASKGGSPTHPDRYHNILAHPEVAVEVATRSGVDQSRRMRGSEELVQRAGTYST
jgi:hypothetical protein